MNNSNGISTGSSSYLPNEDEMPNRSEQKRGYQWLLNASEEELFFHKKQATELVDAISSGAASSEQSVQERNFLGQLENDPSLHSYTSHAREVHNMHSGPIYSTTTGNSIFGQNFFRRGQASDNIMLPYYGNAVQNNVPYVGHSFNMGYFNSNTMGLSYGNGYTNFLVVNPYYSRVNEAFAFDGFTHDNGNLDVTPMIGSVHSELTDNDLSLGNIVNNGGFQSNNHWGIDLSGTQVINNNGLLQDQCFAQGWLSGNFEVESSSRTLDVLEKNKEEKKSKQPVQYNFPVNVKSLLSTGILDGVPVKYVSWSRKKNLLGVIKGVGYLCSCPECKLSKSINSFQFENHAGCKTKHPNNHIYFENGKSIYGVVQELRTTPRDKLYDAIQNATGSLINQKNFLKWKESYEASRGQ